MLILFHTIESCLSKTPQARRITAPAPNPFYIAKGWRRYPKTGFYFASISKALSANNCNEFLGFPAIRGYKKTTRRFGYFLTGSKRRALSMLELLIGIMIFSFAMLPLMSFSASSFRGAYSVGKHMMAGQIAAGLMDRLLANSFDDCLTQVEELARKGRIDLMEDEVLKKAIGKSNFGESKDKFEEDLKKSFKFFKYEIGVKKPEKNLMDQMFQITIKVTWRIDEGNEESRVPIYLYAIKYRDDL